MKLLKIGILSVLILGIAFLIGITYIRVAAPIIAKIDNRKACVPFAQKDVPDENDGNWKLDETKKEYYTSGSEPYLIKKYFSHRNSKGLSLGVYIFFDQIAYKSWACMQGSDFSSVLDYTEAVLKDGKWVNVKPGKMLFISEIHGEKKSLAGVELAAISETNELIHIIYSPK